MANQIIRRARSRENNPARPTHFGPGSQTLATSSTGDFVGVFNGSSSGIIVPTGYISDTPLSDSALYSGATFTSLGVNYGTYVWTWGPGADQNFTLRVGPAVPDSGSTLGLLSVALTAVFGAAKFRSLRLA
jgi:hypothetical protein